ncbi:MAG: tellurite resistance/C4-dicarboxylate transporter family protein [Chloroflexi bacterium]|nr:tellurite resistance/C4-dicarboxylate transporter family protein [Chloroflexota bacterium]
MVLAGAEGLHPSYFALVMATGIISVAAHLLGMAMIARTLFWLNIAAFLTLWALTILRVTRFPRRFLADLSNHSLGPGFFTLVAGASVLSTQFALIAQDYRAAIALWAFASLLWMGLIYTIMTALIVKETKPPIDQGINGGWLTAVVATQSIAASTGLLATHLGAYQEQMFFLALAAWLFGGMLYIWIISLIFYRYCFFKFSPQDLTPPYWINMGAVAISTLSGTILIANVPNFALFQDISPFLKGFTLFFWATGTWWIPMLIVLGVWRHLYKKLPISYSPLYWGAVFPLGMYAAATFQLAAVNKLPFLGFVPQLFFYFAILAWLATFAGLVGGLSRRLVACFRGGL